MVNFLLKKMLRKYWLRIVVLLALLLVGAGCTAVGYYTQIVSGHMRIVMGKKTVEAVVNDGETDKQTRRRLQLAVDARQFGVKQLGLPDNKSYTSFYDTRRNYVTWNVVAADEFSFTPKKWCFPVAGCVSYRGYYKEADAQKYADELAEDGFDIAVNGATAYSTLGWFADPLLNTMLNRSDGAIASLLFHELAHQQLYVGDDSKFNESFAVFVEQQGLALWQQQQGSEDQLAELENRRMRQDSFIELLTETRSDLQTLYASEIDEKVMRTKKSERYEQLRSDYETLKTMWNGYRGYDGWFERELNNARLVSVATYNDYIPAFRVLFEESGSDFPAFYAAADSLSKLPRAERQAAVQQLMKRAEK